MNKIDFPEQYDLVELKKMNIEVGSLFRMRQQIRLGLGDKPNTAFDFEADDTFIVLKFNTIERDGFCRGLFVYCLSKNIPMVWLEPLDFIKKYVEKIL